MFLDIVIILIFLLLRLPFQDIFPDFNFSPILLRVVADSLIIISILVLLRLKGPLKVQLLGWRRPLSHDFTLGLMYAVIIFAISLSVTELKIFNPIINIFSVKSYKIYFLLFITSTTEELFYRGFFLNKILISNISHIYAIIISALVFGLGHIYLGFGAVLFSTIIGALLSYATIKYRSLTLVIVAHTLYNFMAFFLFTISNS